MFMIYRNEYLTDEHLAGLDAARDCFLGPASDMTLGIVTGNPGVFQRNPHPYPGKPAPAVRVQFFAGKGVGFYKTHGFLYKELCTSNLLICIQ